MAEKTMDYAKAVEAGAVKDSTLFYYHRQASDEHDLTTRDGARAAVIEASGPAHVWRDIDAIVGLRFDPTVDPAFWERVWCNRLVQGARQAFDVERWKALKRPDNPVKPGDLITIGFDGALVFDSTSLICTHVKSGFQWKAGLWERPYGQSDWQVPATEVDATVRDLFSRFTVWRMYADPFYWQSWIAKWQGEFGEERVIEWRTNRQNQMAAALENFTTAIVEGAISHDGDEDLARHIGNARKDELKRVDEQGKPLWLIRKERHDSLQKIDAAMAAVLSWEARTDAVASGVLVDEELSSIVVFA